MKVFLWIVLALVAAFFSIPFINPPSPEFEKISQLVSDCWDQYERKSNSPGSKHIIAALCENLEVQKRATPYN